MGSMLIPKLSRLQPSEMPSVSKSKNVSKSGERVRKNVKSGDESEQTSRELAFVSVSDNSECDKDGKHSDNSFSNLFSNARTLKICFGEGEGTVVKIPPLGGDFNEDSGVSCDMSKPSKPDSKAVKKALKKAKRQAKKNSDAQTNVEMWIEQSPKHIGALSPRNNLSNSPPQDQFEKKHKHKVKHKKKHKIQKKRDENSSKCDDKI